MYVQLLKIYAGPSGTFQPGDVVTVTDEEGDALVAGEYGVEVDTADGLPAPVAVQAPIYTAQILVEPEDTNVRQIAIYFTDENGEYTTDIQSVTLVVFADAAGAALATTGGSTGIEIGATGTLITLVSKKVFIGITDGGTIKLTWTDTATEAAYLGVILPNGNVAISDALTNA